jgi:hypothetical protein
VVGCQRPLRGSVAHRGARVAAFGGDGLRWQDVDVDTASIPVVSTRVRIGCSPIATGEPKTAAGRRTVPIDPADTVAALCALKAVPAAERLGAGGGMHRNWGLIAVDEAGRPIRPEVWRQRQAHRQGGRTARDSRSRSSAHGRVSPARVR